MNDQEQEPEETVPAEEEELTDATEEPTPSEPSFSVDIDNDQTADEIRELLRSFPNLPQEEKQKLQAMIEAKESAGESSSKIEAVSEEVLEAPEVEEIVENAPPVIEAEDI